MAYHDQSTKKLVYDNSQLGKDVYILHIAAAESSSQDYHARVDSTLSAVWKLLIRKLKVLVSYKCTSFAI